MVTYWMTNQAFEAYLGLHIFYVSLEYCPNLLFSDIYDVRSLINS